MDAFHLDAFHWLGANKSEHTQSIPGAEPLNARQALNGTVGAFDGFFSSDDSDETEAEEEEEVC